MYAFLNAIRAVYSLSNQILVCKFAKFAPVSGNLTDTEDSLAVTGTDIAQPRN